MGRRGVALGLALGFFFGLLFPLAQMPVSAAAAIALRANVPAAVAATLVTNPLTFAPIYYGAWRLGSAVLGEDGELPSMSDIEEAAAPPPELGWFETLCHRLAGEGKPLVVGLAILSTAVGVATYFLVSWVWALQVRWSRKRRPAQRAKAVASRDGSATLPPPESP